MAFHGMAWPHMTGKPTLPRASLGRAPPNPPPLVAQVSPVIDTGVLGLPTHPAREPEPQPEVVTDVTVNVNADGTVDDGGDAIDAEVMRDESWAAGFAPDLGGAAAGNDDSSGSGFGSGGGYSPARFRSDAEFDVPVKGSEGGASELTVRGEGELGGSMLLHTARWLCRVALWINPSPFPCPFAGCCEAGAT